MKVLRDYQKAALKAHFDYFSNRTGNPLIVMPTGSGKSVVIAEFCKQVIHDWPTQRIIILTHVMELIEQDYEELIGQWDVLAPVGIYSAGVGRRDLGCAVTFAGIQSVWTKLDTPSKAAEALGTFDLVLIDEAHLIPKSGEGRYRSYLAWLRERNPMLKILGYTATPFRLDGGMLHKGDGRIFTDVAYDVPLKKLIGDNYLAPLVAKMPEETIDTKGVGTAVGDFKKGELEEAAIAGDNVSMAVAEMLTVAERDGRKHWLVFACGRKHAEQILEQVRERDVSAELIMGHTPKEERKRIIRDAKAGKITCVVNVGVLTTGFNWPRCDLLAVMRPTQSAALYVQIMGRGMRTFPGKKNCIATGQRVLTSRGLVEIQNVRMGDLVWDGVDFVSHDGVVCQGVRETISYSGLAATEDHMVMTMVGWARFGKCANEGIEILRTASGRVPIKSSGRNYGGGAAERQEAEDILRNEVHGLRERVGAFAGQSIEAGGRLPSVRESSLCTEMAGVEMFSGLGEMQKQRQQALSGLRGEGGGVQIQLTNIHGSLDRGEFGPARQVASDRSCRQRLGVSARESENGNVVTKPNEFKVKEHCSNASVQDGVPQSDVCRRDLKAVDRQRAVVRGDQRQVPQPGVDKAKGLVWDILNAGPRHRFTVEGLLVSNCLVLDYGENVIRHGPINDIRIPDGRIANGEAPNGKTCPQCKSIIAITTKECPDCGHVFVPESISPTHESRASNVSPIDFTPKISPKHTMDCYRVEYQRHYKEDMPESLRVIYGCGLRQFAEWVCLEHTGFPKRKAIEWWLKRGNFPVPETVTEALERVDELSEPTKIIVQESGKYERVVDWIFARERLEDEPKSDEQRRVDSSDQGSSGQASGLGKRPW